MSVVFFGASVGPDSSNSLPKEVPVVANTLSLPFFLGTPEELQAAYEATCQRLQGEGWTVTSDGVQESGGRLYPHQVVIEAEKS